jgi:hypothetical protein
VTASSSSYSFGFIRRRLIIQVVDFGPSNYFLWASSAVLLFELWISVPRIIFLGPTAPSYYLSCGLRSLESFLFGHQCRCPIQVVDSDFIDHFFWDYNIPICYKVCSTSSLFEGVFIAHQVYAFGPSMPLLLPTMGISSPISSYSGLAVPQLQFEWRFWLLETLFHASIYSCLPKFWWQYTDSDALCQIRR